MWVNDDSHEDGMAIGVAEDGEIVLEFTQSSQRSLIMMPWRNAMRLQMAILAACSVQAQEEGLTESDFHTLGLSVVDQTASELKERFTDE